MLGNVLDRLRGVVNRVIDALVWNEATQADQADDGVGTQLFYCPDCTVTFISHEMESCPRCGREVEQVPNERDLERIQIQ